MISAAEARAAMLEDSDSAIMRMKIESARQRVETAIDDAIAAGMTETAPIQTRFLGMIRDEMIALGYTFRRPPYSRDEVVCFGEVES